MQDGVQRVQRPALRGLPVLQGNNNIKGRRGASGVRGPVRADPELRLL